jgi:hypothetical protein
VDFFYQPLSDDIVDHEVEGAGTDTQDEARELGRPLILRCGPPTTILVLEALRVEGVIMVVCAFQKFINENVYFQSAPAQSYGRLRGR